MRVQSREYFSFKIWIFTNYYLFTSNFRDHYHDLIALGEQFIVHLFDFRRGQEGAQKIPKDGWELKEHEGKKAYIKVFSEETKTRKDDVEDEDDFGILPNIDMTNGFNPMVYHGLYLKLLNPKKTKVFSFELVFS